MIDLRDYQREAIDSLYRWLAENEGNPLVVAPTGAGKSVILAEFIRSALKAYPDTRVLVCTHVKELIEQDFTAILRVWPDAPIGIYSAGLGKKQARAQIVVGGVQSLVRARDLQPFDLIIIDVWIGVE
ncbi:MAG: DEAD/DEAH box helicase family protein [Pseudomonadota bacterium]